MDLKQKQVLFEHVEKELATLLHMKAKAIKHRTIERLVEQIRRKRDFLDALRNEIKAMSGEVAAAQKPALRHPFNQMQAAESAEAKALRRERHEAVLAQQAMAKAVRRREHEERMQRDITEANERRKGFVRAAQLSLPNSVFLRLVQEGIAFSQGEPVKPVTWFGRVRSWFKKCSAATQ